MKYEISKKYTTGQTRKSKLDTRKDKNSASSYKLDTVAGIYKSK